MKPLTQRRLRQCHNWLGVFFAPGIIFFSLSGVVQTLGLHERGADRAPAAAWIGLFANVHKEGEVAFPKPRPRPPAAVGKPLAATQRGEESGLPLFKLYVIGLSLALIGTTLIGLSIALTNRNGRRRTTILLVAGCAVPLLLLAI